MTDEREPSAVPDVAELVDHLKNRVAERRRAGDYPSELTAELRSHLERIKQHRPVSDLELLAVQLDALDALGWFSPEKIVLESRVLGVEKFHALVAKTVSRQTQGILEQMQLFGDAVRQALRTVLTALEEPHGHVHDDLLGQVDALQEQVAALERGLGGDAGRRAWLGDLDSMRMAALVEELSTATPVFDVGTGRFREMLAQADVAVDGAEPMSAAPRLHDVEDETLGAVALVDATEQLSSNALRDIAALAHGKLRRGGRLVVYGAPWHPAYVGHLLAEAGFDNVLVEPGTERPEDYVLVAVR